jgi:hypothetical protein
MDYLIIALLSIATLTHLARLCYLFFRPKFLMKFKFITAEKPEKSQLALYYVLTILACIYGISLKVGG